MQIYPRTQTHQRLLDNICRYLVLAALWTKRSVYQESKAQRLRYTMRYFWWPFAAKGRRLPDPLSHRVIRLSTPWAGPAFSYVSLAWLCIWARFTLDAIGAV